MSPTSVQRRKLLFEVSKKHQAMIDLVRQNIDNPKEMPDDPSSAIAKPLPNEPEASIARCGARMADDCKDFIMASDMADNLPVQRRAGGPQDFNVWVCPNCMTELYRRKAAKRQAEQQDNQRTLVKKPNQ